MTDDIELPIRNTEYGCEYNTQTFKITIHSKSKQWTKVVIQRVKFKEHQQGNDSEGHSDNGDLIDASSKDNIEAQSPKEAFDIPAPAVEPQIFK